MKQPTFSTCTINNYGGEYFPRTLSKDNIPLQPKEKYIYTWVNIDKDCENDYSDGYGMIMCIYINNEWHQV